MQDRRLREPTAARHRGEALARPKSAPADGQATQATAVDHADDGLGVRIALFGAPPMRRSPNRAF